MTNRDDADSESPRVAMAAALGALEANTYEGMSRARDTLRKALGMPPQACPHDLDDGSCPQCHEMAGAA